MKVAILGYSGSGKSTLAKKLSETYDLPVLHLDTIQFVENWVERETKEANTLVKQFMQNRQWVIDGNYQKFFQEERLEQADEIIILAFSRWTCLKRVISRYFTYRNTTRPDMASGCTEKLDWQFIWWVLYLGRKNNPLSRLKSLCVKYPGKTVLLKNQKQLNDYYETKHK